MDDKHPEIIIIKRHSHHDEEHHGGAWKIAFADFMTAMMAFFLVLWIINATDKNTRTIISRYFNPLKLEDMTKAKKGIRQTEDAEVADSTAIQTEGAAPKTEERPKAPKEEKTEPTAKADNAKDKEPADPAHPKAHLSETVLFNDPYASLDQIAGKATPQQSPKVGALTGGDASADPAARDLDAFVDPFKPLPKGPVGDSVADPKPETQKTTQPPQAQQSQQPPAQTTTVAQPHPDANAKEPPPLQAAASPPEAERAPATAIPPATERPAAAAAPEVVKLQDELAKELRAETHAQPAPGIEVKATSEGILISLTDELNFGMFASGSAEPQPKIVRIMEKIAQSLKSRPGTIVVRGHTDGRPYKSGTYDNWRLSSARAQMAYYMLIRGGLDEKRIERIEGYADRRLKTPDKPEAAENRRIEILLRKEKP